MPFWDPPTKDGLTFMLESWCLITEAVTAGQWTYTHWHCWQEDWAYHWHWKSSLLLLSWPLLSPLVYEACRSRGDLCAALVLSRLCPVLVAHVLSSHTIFSGLRFSWVFGWCSWGVFYLPSHLYRTAWHPEATGHLFCITLHFSLQSSLEIQSTHPADHPPLGPLLLIRQGSTVSHSHLSPWWTCMCCLCTI